jgi:hypothetical protein
MPESNDQFSAAQEPPHGPGARERGRMRRRLREQRQVREALLLDLGALVFELHRQGRREPELLQAKAAELIAVDTEVRALANALEDDTALLELVASGIAGSCNECGTLLSIDARYCQACGAAAAPELARERARQQLHPEGATPARAQVRAPAGPPPPAAPAAQAEAAEAEDSLTQITNELQAVSDPDAEPEKGSKPDDAPDPANTTEYQPPKR